jgi:hypothetical protein
MANLYRNKRKFTITTQNTYVIGDASKTNVGTILVHLVSSSFSGSITVKSRSREQEAGPDGDDLTFLAVSYLKRNLNAAVADDTLVSTAITDSSIILIPASGQSIALDCTSFISGTMTAYVTKLDGAAA